MKAIFSVFLLINKLHSGTEDQIQQKLLNLITLGVNETDNIIQNISISELTKYTLHNKH